MPSRCPCEQGDAQVGRALLTGRMEPTLSHDFPQELCCSKMITTARLRTGIDLAPASWAVTFLVVLDGQQMRARRHAKPLLAESADKCIT
eukprot:6167558-Pleurochrysis_carterae.AAC.1